MTAAHYVLYANRQVNNISVITTGGTIGSILDGDSVACSATSDKICKELQMVKQKLGLSITITSPLNKNSENMRPGDWATMLHALKSASDSDSNGIVVTHGTDTVEFSVAAALTFSNLWRKKICFTGSYYSPDNPDTDASLNLSAALSFANAKTPVAGVYLVFRGDANNFTTKTIYGGNLKPIPYDGLFFEGEYGDKKQEDTVVPCLGSEIIPSSVDIESVCSQVAMIKLYPGITRDTIERVATGCKFLIVQAYHSGTGPIDEISGLLDFIKASGIKTKVIIATFPKRYIKHPYQSTVALIAAGAYVYELQPHFLYTFLLLGLSLNMSQDELTTKLSSHEVSKEFMSQKITTIVEKPADGKDGGETHSERVGDIHSESESEEILLAQLRKVTKEEWYDHLTG